MHICSQYHCRHSKLPVKNLLPNQSNQEKRVLGLQENIGRILWTCSSIWQKWILKKKKTHRKTLHTYKAPRMWKWWKPCQDVRACYLFFIHNLKRILGVPSSTVNSEVYFDLRQLSIAKLVEDSTLKFLCKLKTYEMIFNILQSLLWLNSKWCNYCNTLL